MPTLQACRPWAETPRRMRGWPRSRSAAIKNTLGGTVNDVVLTVVTLALRRHLMRRGEKIDELELKAFVPVSVRTEDQRGTLGNQVSGMLAMLPVSCADPVKCLAKISAQMRVVKDSGQAIGATALTELSGFAPPTLLHEAARLVTRQRLVNLVVTNVPGPQFPLYLDGREMTDMFPIVPLGGNLNLGIAIVSYDGALDFGIVGDFVVMHDLEDLADDFQAALLELTVAARVAASAAPWPGYDQQTGAGHRQAPPRRRRGRRLRRPILRARAQAPPGRHRRDRAEGYAWLTPRRE